MTLRNLLIFSSSFSLFSCFDLIESLIERILVMLKKFSYLNGYGVYGGGT